MGRRLRSAWHELLESFKGGGQMPPGWQLLVEQNDELRRAVPTLKAEIYGLQAERDQLQAALSATIDQRDKAMGALGWISRHGNDACYELRRFAKEAITNITAVQAVPGDDVESEGGQP